MQVVFCYNWQAKCYSIIPHANYICTTPCSCLCVILISQRLGNYLNGPKSYYGGGSWLHYMILRLATRSRWSDLAYIGRTGIRQPRTRHIMSQISEDNSGYCCIGVVEIAMARIHQPQEGFYVRRIKIAGILRRGEYFGVQKGYVTSWETIYSVRDLKS